MCDKTCDICIHASPPLPFSQDDRDKLAKPPLITKCFVPNLPLVSCSSWWSNWLIPAVAAVIVTLMYRIYTAEEA
uniref:Uncharacterized protein n=1 Tax=Cyprinus carpio TaxID=7962 RepID=A0A8C1XWQ8_CYPCA